MKKTLTTEIETAQRVDAQKPESKYQKLIHWLGDPHIFSIDELEAIASDFEVPYDATSDQTMLASQVVFWVASEKKLTPLLQYVYQERPYLKRNEYPTLFQPELKIQIAEVFTAEFLFFKNHNLETLCDELNLTDELNTLGYYYERVLEVLDAIERHNLTKSRQVQKVIGTLQRKKRALKIFQPEPMAINRRIPEQLNAKTQNKVMNMLRTLSSFDLDLIIAQYDFRCCGARNVTVAQQVFLIYEYATKTNTIPRLITAIHHIFPNIDFSEFGLKPVIRHPNKVKKLKNKENTGYPNTVSQEHASRLQKYLRELSVQNRVQSSQYEEIANILGYKLMFDRGLEGPYLVKVANSRSEIHLLLLAFEQVTKIKVPKNIFHT